LDLGAHVDSVKFSGKIVSSLSLRSTRILRLTPEYNDSENIASGQEPWCEADVLRLGLPTVVEVILNPRSFYVLAKEFRYRYKHEILGESLRPQLVPSDSCPVSLERRFSIMARDALKP
jgi:alkylated DNA repair protein alkB family protein 7